MVSMQKIALDRFGLGARPADRVGSDPRGWAVDQLTRFDPAPPPIAALPGRAALIGELAEYRSAQAERRQAKRDAGDQPAGRNMARQPLRQSLLDAIGARTASAATSETPFAERLVHFWANHFAVSTEKIVVALLAGNFEFAAIRPHVMGRFADLLTAAVTHPAMMLFLDQAQSIGPDSLVGQRATANGRKRGLNENLAREIMELHTLGVRTGYAQADVTEFARALTGWTVAGLGQGPAARLAQGEPGAAVFAPAVHQPGARTIMGKTYPANGGAQAQAVLADLAAHPATARHVATKLARHFIADDPPPAAVDRLAAAFTASEGDLPTVYRALVASPEAWAAADTKFRSPWDWTLAALRATGTQELGGRAMANTLRQLGQPVWQPGSPAGWGDTSADWAGSGALMSRVEVAQRIAQRVGDRIDARQLAPVVLADALTDDTRSAIARSEQPALGLALMLSSPEFMRR